MRVAVIYKKSVFQKYIESNKNRHLASLYADDHPATARFRKAHQHHLLALKKVETTLKKRGISFDVMSRKETSILTGYDLVISVGGDGTFLKSSHRITTQPILGVNSVPHASVGALLTTCAETFEKKLVEFIKGKAKIKKLNRLSISIDGTPLPFSALNDVLFSHQNPAGVSRYTLTLNEMREEQRSSGIWISTATGSTGALKAAGGKRMAPLSSRLQFCVREPMQIVNKKKLKLLQGFILPHHHLEVTNQTIEAILHIDGIQTAVPLLFGQQLRFESSPVPLNVLI